MLTLHFTSMRIEGQHSLKKIGNRVVNNFISISISSFSSNHTSLVDTLALSVCNNIGFSGFRKIIYHLKGLMLTFLTLFLKVAILALLHKSHTIISLPIGCVQSRRF